MRRWIIVWVWISLTLVTVRAQDTSPSIPVGLSDPYLMFVPVGWRTSSPNPFGFITAENADLTLNVLDPVRLESFIPYEPDTSPRQLLIDYTQFFYVETISRLQIDLLTIGDNTVAIYRDPELPQLATYAVELPNQRYALIEVEANDGAYDSEESTVHAIIGTLTTSTNDTSRTDVLFDTVVLPSERYSISLPPNWGIEPSFVPGQLFLVGDDIEMILFPPDSIDGYFSYPDDVDLAELAQVIETEFFDVDLTNVDLTRARAGDRRAVAYGFRSLNGQTDTQVLLVQLPDGGISYVKTVVPQATLTPLLEERISRIALSIERYNPSTLDTDQFDDPVAALIIPNSGQWRIELRDMMRFVCDGTIEKLIPLNDDIRGLFGDFDTIVADPDGDSLTIASDGVVTLFQRGTLLRDDTPYFQITGEGRGYTITPISAGEMHGRLNIISEQDDRSCRIGVSLTLRFVE